MHYILSIFWFSIVYEYKEDLIMNNGTKVIEYITNGTCSKLIRVAINQNRIVDAEFVGGCNGNLQGIRKLIIGMDVDDVVSKLEGINCGPKNTSCPDQLAQCLIQYKQQSTLKI